MTFFILTAGKLHRRSAFVEISKNSGYRLKIILFGPGEIIMSNV